MFQEQNISVGGWFVFYVLSCIPGVNVIVWLVLLLSAQTNKSLKNLLVLQFIFAMVGVVLTIAFWGLIIASIGSTA